MNGMKTMSKQIKQYVTSNVSDLPHIIVGFGAWVKSPRDPSLDIQESNLRVVKTSRVIRYDESTGEFETLNSIYKKVIQ